MTKSNYLSLLLHGRYFVYCTFYEVTSLSMWLFPCPCSSRMGFVGFSVRNGEHITYKYFLGWNFLSIISYQCCSFVGLLGETLESSVSAA